MFASGHCCNKCCHKNKTQQKNLQKNKVKKKFLFVAQLRMIYKESELCVCCDCNLLLILTWSYQNK